MQTHFFVQLLICSKTTEPIEPSLLTLGLWGKLSGWSSLFSHTCPLWVCM